MGSASKQIVVLRFHERLVNSFTGLCDCPKSRYNALEGSVMWEWNSGI